MISRLFGLGLVIFSLYSLSHKPEIKESGYRHGIQAEYSDSQTEAKYGNFTLKGSPEEIKALAEALNIVYSDSESKYLFQYSATIQATGRLFAPGKGEYYEAWGLANPTHDFVYVNVNRETPDIAGTLYHELLHIAHPRMGHDEIYPLQREFVKRWGGVI